MNGITRSLYQYNDLIKDMKSDIINGLRTWYSYQCMNIFCKTGKPHVEIPYKQNYKKFTKRLQKED